MSGFSVKISFFNGSKFSVSSKFELLFLIKNFSKLRNHLGKLLSIAYEVLSVIKRILLSFCGFIFTKALQCLHAGKISTAKSEHIKIQTIDVFILFKKIKIKNIAIPPKSI
jgi:hypothetical protein